MLNPLAVFSFVFLALLSSSPLYGDEPDFVVALDGSGDFTSIQAAIDAVPEFRKQRTIIYVKPGLYEERLTLASTKNLVSLIGEDANSTIVATEMHAKTLNRFGEEVGTTGSSGFFVFGSGFICKNMTFENRAGPVGQAVAVRVDGDRVFFENCRFIGNQDTLYPHGQNSRQYYKNCYIEGTVDFIFGWSTAYFEDCEIFCKTSGYVTAASTVESQAYGFVFKNCRITGNAPKGSFYLGRPWRPFAKTVFIDCYLSEVIKAEGWHNWGKPDAERTTFYAEYGSTGPGFAGSDAREGWSHQIQTEELSNYTAEAVLGDWDLSSL
ncbi:pectinesterase family protein [Pelagicoccus albus]|uniref:Pectinesterase n=1 Tax=Pelagicoccus albus TaxID=415222 RepID=A0A7X1B4R0_9BACT|nr:pectinesterase family protein [Pelagicoccus albus]MBC2605577.1 pectin esterase [Pelagicoccus albus]